MSCRPIIRPATTLARQLLRPVRLAGPLTNPRRSTPAAIPHFWNPQINSFSSTTRLRASSQVPQKMKAVLIRDGKGPVENLYIGEEATPEPEKGQVQVQIKNFGLNRMDLMQREGKYPLPPQASKTIMGVEFSGIVTKAGEGCKKYKEGDEVFGLAYGGAYAEYIVVPEGMVLEKPKELSWVEAAALPENWMTAYQALVVEGGMKKGDNVLIHAGASGVGVAAIQLALNVTGADKVFTTCGTDEKVAFLQNLANNDPRLHVINYKTQNFEEEIKKVTDGVDHIIEFIGKNYWTQNLNVLRRDGVMVYLAFMSGPTFPPDANIAPLLFKRLTLKGSTLRSRDAKYQQNLLEKFEELALPLLKERNMKIEVHDVLPWTKIQDAHNMMQGNKNSGKIVLEVTDSQ